MRPVHPVTHSGTAGQDTNERLVAACPSWCDRDEKVDEGTPEEFVIHCGAESYVGSIRLQLRQVTFVDGAFEPPVLLLGEDELPMADAAHLAPVLAATAAEATGARYAQAMPDTRPPVDDTPMLYQRCLAS
ncbi:hypothetical protein FHU33_1771 [Blastococcus colisei]|uniref:Uncharacterized protein n=1 Tax=Blastococcus colisei TaxID=1564162 RepID=A0A543PE64_9ACTN|nr:hypothetical protein [Blastococcus colisei]TQN42372.1 hypothetical protein FHU33_1771 [Blastococcus colisei]